MKIFINDAKEDWIVDRLKEEFSVHNPELITNNLAFILQKRRKYDILVNAFALSRGSSEA